MMNVHNQMSASLTIENKTVMLPIDQTIELAEGLQALVSTAKQGDVYQYRTMTVTNTGTANSGQITCPRILDAVIPCDGPVKLHTLRGDDCSKYSFLPVDMVLTEGDTLHFAPSGGRPSNTTAFPILDLDFGGYALLFAIGWDGQWQCDIHMTEGKLNLQIGMEYADFYLEPGESVNLPSLLLLSEGDGASARRAFRHLLTTDFSPLPQGYTSDHLPVSIQPFDRYFYGRCPLWPTEEGQLLTLEKTVQCGGMDTLWIDAAWFRDGFPTGVGNYEFAPGFPRGLRPVADAVHKAGMRFMVWFEPERIARGSDIFHQHRPYYLCKMDDFEAEHNFLYNLGNEEAWQWLYNTLSNFLRDNGIDNFRQDFNFDPLPYWLYNDTPGRVGMTEIRYVNGFYRLWDSLRAEFPHLFIDNCSSGGRRIEFETLRRAVPMWRSDITCGPITETAHNDVYNHNQTLTLGEYLPFHACATWEPNANDLRSAATAGLACTFDILNPDFDAVTAGKLLEETHRLASLWTGDFYPLTKPTLEENVFVAYQLHKENKGYAAVFRLAECIDTDFVLRLQTIDPVLTYEVTFTDEQLEKRVKTIAGADLAAGLVVTLPDARSSMIVEYQKI